MHYTAARAAAVAFAAVLAVGCNHAASPTDHVNRALREAHLNDVKVDWDKDAHIAHLQGTVDSAPDKRRAEKVAAAAVGTSGRVLNELTIRGVNDKSAGALDDDIKSNLKNTFKDDATLEHRDIDIEVHNGVVTLKGQVQSAAEKHHASELVRGAPGVKQMANAIEIKPAR